MIAIVDDHELIALAIQGILADTDGLAFARHAPTVSALVSRPRDADIVLLDLSLRDGSSPAENVEALREWGAAVVVLTSAEDPYLVREAARTAAEGLLRKSARSEVLRASLLDAARGRLAVSPEWASALDTDPLMDAAPLTDRERQVLSLYASGLGAKQVASRLYVSENTVDDHLRRIRSIYQQIGRPAATKIDLYRRGVEDGFLPGPTRG
ncbi:LuxR family two component transcriptional regulator [Microbacterium sp. SLBN-146]|nr:LuxR family two component transcriptional regulator [Microbacterium sp. SLBN-146]